MGSSLSTKIVYGYDIGGPADGWNLEEYDDRNYVMHWPLWMDLPEDEDEEPDDVETQVEQRLLAEMSDFEEIPWERRAERPDNYSQLRHQALADIGISVMEFGTSGWQGNVLGFNLYSGRGCLAELDLSQIKTDSWVMTTKLTKAIEVLGLHPRNQPTPRLLVLTSYW